MGATSHEAGLELLEAMTAALAAVNDSQQASSTEERHKGGLLLWTSLHGLIQAFTEHPQIGWPAVDDLVVSIVALHTQRAPADIAAQLTAN